MLRATIVLVMSALSTQCGHSAQLPVAPTNTLQYDELEPFLPMNRVSLPDNQPEQIRKEILNTNLFALAMRSAGVSPNDAATLVIAQSRFTQGIALYELGTPSEAFTAMSARLRAYANARTEGHTVRFAMAALTNTVEPKSIPDGDLRLLAESRPDFPVSWLRKSGEGTVTNKAGNRVSVVTTYSTQGARATMTSVTNVSSSDEVSRWVSFAATDGVIRWQFTLTFSPSGTLQFMDEEKRDRKEYDPRFTNVLAEVDRQVESQMRSSGTWGKSGSFHEFWSTKAEMLKSKGIEWRSPGELNGRIRYD